MMNLTGKTTTATECTCHPLKVTARSVLRMNQSTWSRLRQMVLWANRSNSKPIPTMWISIPPHGGLQTRRIISPAPPTPGCKWTLRALLCVSVDFLCLRERTCMDELYCLGWVKKLWMHVNVCAFVFKQDWRTWACFLPQLLTKSGNEHNSAETLNFHCFCF